MRPAFRKIGMCYLPVVLYFGVGPSAQSQPPSAVEAHEKSGIAFPKRIGEFERVSIRSYNAAGTDASAGYNCRNALHPMAITVYVYPAPSLISIGSPQDVIDSARDRLMAAEFETRKKEIANAHPEATVIEERKIAHKEGGTSHPGRLAVYEFRQVFAGIEMTVRSHLYVYGFVGGKWTVKYRITHPAALDASMEISEFISAFKWNDKAR